MEDKRQRFDLSTGGRYAQGPCVSDGARRLLGATVTRTNRIQRIRSATRVIRLWERRASVDALDRIKKLGRMRAF